MKWRQPTGNRSWLAIVFLLGIGLLSARATAADAEEVARKHAAKANQLAARNKCGKAIFAFTRAYKTLKDPTLLFNRAECFRKVGRDDEAITDYEQFLAEVPQAPNRAAVEARIASLRGARGTLAGKEKPTATAPTLPKPPEKAPPPAGGAPTTRTAETGAAAPSGPKPTPFSEPGDRPAGPPTAAATPSPKPTDKPAEKTATPSATPSVPPAENAPATSPAPAQSAGRSAEKWTD